MVFYAFHSVPTTSSTTPASPMLVVQCTGSCKFHVIFGITKYIGNHLAPPNGLNGSFLALGTGDLLSPAGDTPQASILLLLPDDVFKTNVVDVPTDTNFLNALNEKVGTITNIHLDATQWFKSGMVQGRATLPKATPSTTRVVVVSHCISHWMHASFAMYHPMCCLKVQKHNCKSIMVMMIHSVVPSWLSARQAANTKRNASPRAPTRPNACY